MTFRLELTNNSIFKTIFESVASIIDEVTLIADKDGLRMRALDKSHITFISLDFEYSLFDEYICDVPEKINIDADQFAKILKKCKTSDILKLSVDEGNLIVIFEGDASRKFNIRLIDIEYTPTEPPLVEHPVNLSIPSEVLKDALGDLSLFSEKLAFTVDADYLRISADGLKGEGDIRYIHGENVKESCQSMFSIKKLQDIMKASKFSKECALGLGDNLPLSLTFKLVTDDGKLSYLLAPRLSEE